MRRPLIAVLIAVVVAVTAGVVIVVAGTDDDPAARAAAAARSYLDAWEQRQWDEMATQVDEPPEGFTATHQQITEALDISQAAYEPGAAEVADGEAVVPFQATLLLAGLGEWRFNGQLTLRPSGNDGAWLVRWDASVIHPSLQPGMTLERTRQWPERGSILGHDGAPLVRLVEVVEIGVQPSRITDRAALLAALEEHLGVDPAEVQAALDRPGVQPDWFIPVATLRPDEYDAIQSAIYPVPGTVFRRTTQRLPPTDDFASHVLGRTGEITAELLEELGQPYVQHDVVGRSGLELAFNARLAGAPSGEVRLVSDGTVVEVLHRFPGEPAQPLRITLDQRVQLAAENAVAGVAGPVAVVALAADSSEVRAVVSRPLNEFNRALSGRYPPGSTFKIVTAAAGLRSGTGTADTVPCPAEVTVDGRRFRNAGGEAHGDVTFAEAFALSCNTVFAPLAANVDDQLLAATAADFGFGVAYAEDMPLPAFGGRFPKPTDDAEAAAAGIGQGRVEASPMHMAAVAGAVASGGWRPPLLIADGERASAAALDGGVAAMLQDLMRRVVTSGTGTPAAVPGRTIAGKTGTAEFGTGDPPPTHAWFVAYDAGSGIAVAVLVEGGASGGSVAAPIAARFFAALP